MPARRPTQHGREHEVGLELLHLRHAVHKGAVRAHHARGELRIDGIEHRLRLLGLLGEEAAIEAVLIGQVLEQVAHGVEAIKWCEEFWGQRGEVSRPNVVIDVEAIEYNLGARSRGHTSRQSHAPSAKKRGLPHPRDSGEVKGSMKRIISLDGRPAASCSPLPLPLLSL